MHRILWVWAVMTVKLYQREARNRAQMKRGLGTGVEASKRMKEITSEAVANHNREESTPTRAPSTVTFGQSPAEVQDRKRTNAAIANTEAMP